MAHAAPSKLRIVVTRELAALGRLDHVLPAALPAVSRRAWRGALDAGALRRNGDTTRVQGRAVSAGDVLEVHVGKLLEVLGRGSSGGALLPAPALRVRDDVDDATVLAALAAGPGRPSGAAASGGLPFAVPPVCAHPPALDILAVDSRLLVVNKPAGVLCQAADRAAPSGATEVVAADADDARGTAGGGAIGAAASPSSHAGPSGAAAAGSGAGASVAMASLRYASMPLDALVAWWLAHHAAHGSAAAGGFLHMYHRIDRGASGAVLFVRNQALLPHLDEAWDAGGVERRYIAVVQVRDVRHIVKGVPAWTARVARDPIGRIGGSGWKFGVSPSGRPARTDLRVLATGRGFAVVAAAPTTGRTHQIRVHLAAAGHPIVGDTLYGADTARWPVAHSAAAEAVGRGSGFAPPPPRVLLHSQRIAFREPVRHARLDAEAPLPADVAAWVAAATTVLGDI